MGVDSEPRSHDQRATEPPNTCLLRKGHVITHFPRFRGKSDTIGLCLQDTPAVFPEILVLANLFCGGDREAKSLALRGLCMASAWPLRF